MVQKYEDLMSASVLKDATVDQFLWAVSIVHSRSVIVNVNGTNRRVLMPFFDLMNHGVPIGANTSGIQNVELEVNEGTMLIYATSALRKGDELLLSYGRRSND